MARNVTVLYNHLPRLQRQLPGAISNTVAVAAHKCEIYAKDVVPVDTGALRASIESHPVDEQTWEVEPHTEYAGYVEFGTRRMRAQPYMRPAAEKIRKEFPDLIVQAIVKTAKGQGEWYKANAPDTTVEEG